MSDSQRPHGLQPTRFLCHGIFQARVLEWGAIAFSQRSLVGYSPWGRKRTGHNLSTKEQQRTYFNYSCKAILMATNSFNFSLSDKVLLSFFSFWYSHCICYNFFSYPIILEYSVLAWVFFFQSLSSQLFRFEDSIEIYSSFEILSRAEFSLQISPSKAFFISVTVFF